MSNLLYFRKKATKNFFRLRSLKKRKENKEKKERKNKSLKEIIQELEFCAPYCEHASFPEEAELCKYSGMLKCSKYNELVPKYAPCLKKKKS